MSETIKPKIKNTACCDGCDQLIILQTLSQHRQCKIYKINMLQDHSLFLTTMGKQNYPRPDICKKEHHVD